MDHHTAGEAFALTVAHRPQMAEIGFVDAHRELDLDRQASLITRIKSSPPRWTSSTNVGRGGVGDEPGGIRPCELQDLRLVASVEGASRRGVQLAQEGGFTGLPGPVDDHHTKIAQKLHQQGFQLPIDEVVHALRTSSAQICGTLNPISADRITPDLPSQPAARAGTRRPLAGCRRRVGQAKSSGLKALGSTRTSQLPETSRITASTP